MCFVFIWKQTATCATYTINWLVFITEMKSVYCAVRTGLIRVIVLARRRGSVPSPKRSVLSVFTSYQTPDDIQNNDTMNWLHDIVHSVHYGILIIWWHQQIKNFLNLYIFILLSCYMFRHCRHRQGVSTKISLKRTAISSLRMYINCELNVPVRFKEILV